MQKPFTQTTLARKVREVMDEVLRPQAGGGPLLYFPGALMPTVDPVEIPNRSLFRQPEVCEIAKVQPFVLRTWEAEFPDLGVAKTAGGPRVYRRVDVERVLRLKHLLYVEGLTLAGARRKLSEEQPGSASDGAELTEVAELLGAEARDRILHVRRGLRELSVMLAKAPAPRGQEPADFELKVAPPAPKARRKK